MMAERSLQQLLRHLRRVASPAGGLSDAELLGRFADGRDEAAFEALVWRHGPLVYGVCRRLLGHTQDAEDAFQASFLILARKAGGLRRRGAVAPWLHRVAERVASRARGRNRASEPLPPELAAPRVADVTEGDELRRLLTDEVMRLPARYRSAVVLRYLEGRSTAEAASAIGCPQGTVLSRLAWARKRLRTRLAARGAALSAAVAVSAAGEAGAVPAFWVSEAVGSAAAFAAGTRSGRPAILAMEVLRAMIMTRLRVGAVMAIGVLAAGAGLLVPSVSPARTDSPEQPKQAAIELTAAPPRRHSATGYLDFNGTTEASATVDVRSRVTSPIVRVTFQPGARVRRGDLLFDLDPRTFEVEYQRAQAEVARAESKVRNAQWEYDRDRKLVEAKSGSESDASHSRASFDDARAGLAVAKTGLERARLDLDATRITSPIDGQTGGRLIGVGNLATPDTTLVTVVAADPLYVEFQVPEDSIGILRKLFPSGDLIAQIGLARETGFPRRGKVVFVDNRVQPEVGAVRVRALLPNPDGDILPGMFAKVRLTFAKSKEELRLPNAAVRWLGGVPSVLVPGPDNAIEWRRIEVSQSPPNAEEITILSGIGPETRVIVDKELPPSGVPIRIRDTAPEK
jgi:RND family efflux transporter MFP subunit